MVVQHNLTAMNANRYLGINNSKLSKSLEKLSSGYAINRAGDNAAGLAVSEKMRSQIAGMTQGVKNAQDGISMVQTFEGALTETHSILQRMKTLADQMANGSYDDPVDRTAAQQEFLQLNDELDQIADTDFNGVVVLNGGQMADGTKAVNGQFDYKAGVKAPTKLGKSDVNVLDEQAWNNTGVANAAWSKLNDSWLRGDARVDNDGPNAVDITFKFDGATNTWKAVEASNGANLKDKDNNDVVTTTNTTNGGFKVAIGGVNVSNVVINQDKLANGDTITLTFKNPAAGISAPTDAGAKVADSTGFTAGATSVENVDLSVSLADPAKVAALATAQTKFTDDTKTGGTLDTARADAKTAADTAYATAVGAAGGNAALIQAAQDTKDAAYAKAEKDYNDGIVKAGQDLKAAEDAAAAPMVTNDKMTQGMKDTYGLFDGAKIDVTYGKNTAGDATAVKGIKIELTNGTKISFDTSDADIADKPASIVMNGETYKVSAAADTGVISVTNSDGSLTLMTLSPKDLSTTDTDDGAGNDSTAAGTISYTIGFEHFAYDAAAVPSVEVAKTGKVSTSDAFNKSEAILTYKDNITLQVGARTKDAVNFTFQYASTSIGDLKDDLDCTSRGLGTDKLNINTQEAANYAIDKIDQAINKVSLIRGTFGAIQNRLEHKIDNMNVSIENLTSAESQIRDTNMPQEMMNFTKQQILAQASQSMLAQANQLPQGVLSLLQ